MTGRPLPQLGSRVAKMLVAKGGLVQGGRRLILHWEEMSPEIISG
jgi:hypothetical protein